MYIIIALVVSLLGLWLSVNYLAYKDGVRNDLTFQAVWLPCAKTSNIHSKLNLLATTIEYHKKADNLEKQMFTLDCGIVVYKHIQRKHPNVDLSQITVNKVPFVQYVEQFTAKVNS